MSQQQLETLFEFPCQFPIKVMGNKTADVKNIVLSALTSIGVDASTAEVQIRESSGGTYLSVTALFKAESKEQLDQLYQLLSSNSDIKMVL